jgi:hypothetical protein
VIVFAINVHSGGGGLLLKTLLEKNLFGEVKVLFHDSRFSPPLNTDRTDIPIRATVKDRLKAENKLRELLPNFPQEEVLFFGNLPPLRKITNKSILYLQNALLFPTSPTPSENWKIWLKYKIEKFYLRQFVKNVDEIWLQTEWMKKTAEKTLAFPSDKILRKLFIPDLPEAHLGNSPREFDYILVSGPESHKRLLPFLRSLLENIEKLKGKKILLVSSGQNLALLKTLNEIERISPGLLTTKFHLKREDLLNLYSQAKAILILSTHESLCLPVYEARHYGAEVVTIDVDFLDAGLAHRSFLSFQDFFATLQPEGKSH